MAARTAGLDWNIIKKLRHCQPMYTENIYAVSRKSCHYTTFAFDFATCWPIFKIIPVTYLATNFL